MVQKWPPFRTVRDAHPSAIWRASLFGAIGSCFIPFVILMVWDKLFGTYQREDDKVVYGLTRNIHTNNPVRITFVRPSLELASDDLRD